MHKSLKTFAKPLVGGAALGLLCAGTAQAAGGPGRFSVGPYVSISSSKTIKPKVGEEANSSEEKTIQRTTYGLKGDIRLSRFFSLGFNAGTNQVDTTKKAVAMRDEFGEIDFEKDANVNPADQDAEYRYQEKQYLGVAKILFSPTLTNMLRLHAGGGVRARQREVEITDKVANTSEKVKDPIRYHAVASAGFTFRPMQRVFFSMMYNFYFIKFPDTEPHEQEATIGFGVNL